MDQEIRNKLRNVVTQCRELLEVSISQELEGKYGVFAKKDQVTANPNATMTHLSEEEQAARKDILDHFGHIKARGFMPKEALDQLVREIAFTHLNRLCAYKMMEAREVYVGGQKFREAVSRGINSNGVKFYLANNPEEERLFNTGHQDVAYRHFLDWLGEMLSDEIGVLFNPNDSANRLYPRQKTLNEIVDLLNSGGIKAEETELRDEWSKIWSQDETIGWVYQYFTPKELRDQARKESASPRNSYELAFRNQFFTPRYVVEFLTDNTLARIWYEMRNGDTKLKDQCRYLVRRPTESFLKEGEQPPKDAAEERDDLSQQELLKLPIHIPHRPKKDPRELKILDPACGSGQFLLHCFDLLLTIYEEAYADPELGAALQQDYPTLEDLRRDVPRLILAHNVHGIDIDLRCTQIAALVLWLRCQRAYQEMGLKKDRPKIARSNFVCAEPMPGEKQMLTEFVGQLEPKLLGQVVEVVFDKMKLAGEAGSLLKIEEEIRDAVAAAKTQWLRETNRALDRKGQPLLFTQSTMDRLAGKQEQHSRFDLTDITDDQFFEQAEAKVIESLRKYAEMAHNGQRLQWRLFMTDAVRGFALVDLCQKRYDVVLMSPPFGEPSKLSKGYIVANYPRTKNDVFAAFVERGVTLLEMRGTLGAITSRQGFFLSSFQKWREEILLRDAKPIILADLGFGVLDTAMVETAAYCLSKGGQRETALFIRLLHDNEKLLALEKAVNSLNNAQSCPTIYEVGLNSFRQVPRSPFAYWVSGKVRRTFAELLPFEGKNRKARLGVNTTDDHRFLRHWWEVENSTLDRRWFTIFKGGGFAPFYRGSSLVIDWEKDGRRLKEYIQSRGDSPSRNVRSEQLYFEPGLTYSSRTQKGLAFQPLPAKSLFTVKGPGIFSADSAELPAMLGLMNSSPFRLLVSIQMAFGSYEVGVIQRAPIPVFGAADKKLLSDLALACVDLKRSLASADETSRLFCGPSLIQKMGETLSTGIAEWQRQIIEHDKKVCELQSKIDEIVVRLYGLSCQEHLEIKASTTSSSEETDRNAGDGQDDDEEEEEEVNTRMFGADLLSFLLGVVLGRWDVRKATRGASVLRLPEIFAPLPACSPAMLQGSDGLPLTAASKGEALNIDWEGIVVDDPEHTSDVIHRVRDVFELVWKDRAEFVEREACEILCVKELREYFRRPASGGFWLDHVSRYNKSRRKAPIYWLLQSSKKSYALWLYYHRLDKDLIFKALVNYVEPKIRLETSRIEALHNQKSLSGDSGKEAKRLAKELEREEDFLSELRDFEDKLRRAANLHLEPDLNDGVALNIAPLWELVPWKEAKNYWDELLKGKYEWSSIGEQLRQKGLVK